VLRIPELDHAEQTRSSPPRRVAPCLLSLVRVKPRGNRRERRSLDRPIKRLRQLQARLDALLHESQALRNTSSMQWVQWPTVPNPDELVRGRG
jgi:hypothetical protein